MVESSLLETTAQVSVAFAGFIGVFLILATRDGRFAADDSVAIRTIVGCSVGPVYYSALPLVLNLLGISGTFLWRVSSIAMTILTVSLSVHTIRFWRVSSADRLPFANVLAVSMLGTLMFICLLGNSVAWPRAASGCAYLLAVWCVLGVAGTNFVTLIFRKVLTA